MRDRVIRLEHGIVFGRSGTSKGLTDNKLCGQEKRGGVSGELVSTETAALFFRRRSRRDSPRVAETTAEGRQVAQTHPPREYPLAEGDPKGTLVGVQRPLLAVEGIVSRTTPRGSRGGDRFSREE